MDLQARKYGCDLHRLCTHKFAASSIKLS